MAALQKGQMPAGVKLEKQSEPSLKTGLPAPKAPTPPVPQIQTPRVELGPTEKSKSLPGAPIAPTGIKPLSVPSMSVPSSASSTSAKGLGLPNLPSLNIPEGAGGFLGRINKKLLLGGLVLLVLIGGVIWFLSSRSPGNVTVETTTTITGNTTTSVKPTPATISISTLFTSFETMTIPNTGDPVAALKEAVNDQNLELGEVKVFHVVDQNNTPYPLDGFLGRLLIAPPSTADTSTLKTTNWVFGIYGQQRDSSPDFVDTRNFILAEIGNNQESARNLLTAWNPTIIPAFAPMFNFDGKTQNQLSPDSYNGANFSYVRIPDKNLGLAESVFKNFLFLASSKDSFRSVIDLILSKSN